MTIFRADLADMQLISKFNKGFRFLLCVIDIYSKYTWIIPLKDIKGTTITNPFQNFLKESNPKPNKIWIDEGSKFYKRTIKSWLKNNIKMYSKHNEGKSVIPERFIRTLTKKICKYATSISKNVYIDKSDDTVNKYHNTYHNTNKMKPVDVTSSTRIDSCKVINDRDPKFKVGDVVKISKYKNIFEKG